MKRPVLAAGGFALLAFIIWAIYPSSPEARSPEKPVVEKTQSVERPREEAARAPEPVAKQEPEEEEEAPRGKLDPKSDEFFDRVDNVIPAKLYTAAAEACWNPNLPKDPKIKLKLKLRSIEGQILVWSADVMESTIKDRELADCIVSAVKNASWHDDEMPDWEDEDELLIRLGGMKKHVEDQGDDEPGHPVLKENYQEVLGEE